MGFARRIADYAKGIFTDTNGNVGIGTSSPESIANYKVLDVGSSSSNRGVINAKDGTVIASLWTINDGKAWVGTRSAHPVVIAANGSEGARLDTSGNFSFNSGYGSVATAYGCRAWVNFNGTGTVAIRASGNVSSITDLGTGYFRLNFSTAMPDANYAVAGVSSSESSFGGVLVVDPSNVLAASVNIYTCANNASAVGDYLSNSVAIFR